jgi:predicted lipoprotein
METTAQATRARRRQVAADDRGTGASPWRRRLIGVAALVALLVAMVLSTTFKDADAPVEGAPKAFDPATYGKETYGPKVVPAIDKAAVELPTLAQALAADPAAAGEQYGKRPGPSSPYSYAVKFTGTAAAPQSGLMQVTVPGVSSRVSVQIGPAVNGTALRDAVGFIEFGQFLNQVEYADAATALNTQMKQDLLTKLDPPSLAGKQVTVVGATTILTPGVITVTPVSLEAAP